MTIIIKSGFSIYNHYNLWLISYKVTYEVEIEFIHIVNKMTKSSSMNVNGTICVKWNLVVTISFSYLAR